MSRISGSAAEAIGVGQWSTATASSTPLAGTALHMENWGKALVVFRTGDMAAETIDCVVQTCDSDGSNGATLKAATQLAAHASNNDSKVIVIAVDANELTASGKQYVRGVITTGGVTGGTCSIVAIGVEPRHGLASELDAAAVVEVVK